MNRAEIYLKNTLKLTMLSVILFSLISKGVSIASVPDPITPNFDLELGLNISKIDISNYLTVSYQIENIESDNSPTSTFSLRIDPANHFGYDLTHLNLSCENDLNNTSFLICNVPELKMNQLITGSVLLRNITPTQQIRVRGGLFTNRSERNIDNNFADIIKHLFDFISLPIVQR